MESITRQTQQRLQREFNINFYGSLYDPTLLSQNQHFQNMASRIISNRARRATVQGVGDLEPGGGVAIPYDNLRSSQHIPPPHHYHDPPPPYSSVAFPEIFSLHRDSNTTKNGMERPPSYRSAILLVKPATSILSDI